MKKAVIFDLDGTLSDTIETIAYYANGALTAYGLDPIPTESYKLLVGDGAKTLVKRMLDTLDVEDESLFQQVLDKYNSDYNADVMYLTKVYDGIYKLIDALKEKGVKVAVLSNKPHDTTTMVLDKLFPNKPFDAFFGAREGVPLKPDPTALNELVTLLGVEKEDCLYVGDTAVDMKTGKSGGLFTVGVLWGFRDLSELTKGGADTVISTPHQLVPLLQV